MPQTFKYRKRFRVSVAIKDRVQITLESKGSVTVVRVETGKLRLGGEFEMGRNLEIDAREVILEDKRGR